MLYKRLLGDDFDRLAPALRKLHADGGARAKGSVSVRHERAWLARLAGFPKAGENIQLELAVEAAADGETWTRSFGGVLLRSEQRCENGRMVEQMGAIRLHCRVFRDGEDLRVESIKARWLGVPVPVEVKAVERGRGGDRVDFEVHVSLVGAYAGVLELAP